MLQIRLDSHGARLPDIFKMGANRSRVWRVLVLFEVLRDVFARASGVTFRFESPPLAES
jgi:hypothetical protein